MQTPNSTSNFNSHGLNRTIKRLLNEFKKISNNLPDNILVEFNEDIILEWHFLFIGPKGTPFEEGEYHGVLVFPENYPFSPPSIRFITPNGRFKTDERVCFDLSDFHPECWKPAYTVSAVLQGVYSFMMTETTDTVGSLNMNENDIKSLARKSREFNKKNKVYKQLFEEKVHEIIKHPPNYNYTEVKRKEITTKSTDSHLKKFEIIQYSRENCRKEVRSTNPVLNSPILKDNRIKSSHLNQVSTPDVTTRTKHQSKFKEKELIAGTSVDDSRSIPPKRYIRESPRGNQRKYTLDNTTNNRLGIFIEKQGMIMDSKRGHSSERSLSKQRYSMNKSTQYPLDRSQNPHPFIPNFKSYSVSKNERSVTDLTREHSSNISSERPSVNQRCISGRNSNYSNRYQNFPLHAPDCARYIVAESESDPAFYLKKSCVPNNSLIPFSQSLADAKVKQSRERNLMRYNIPNPGYSSRDYVLPPHVSSCNPRDKILESKTPTVKHQISPFYTQSFHATVSLFCSADVFPPHPPISSNNSSLSQSFYINRPINYPPSYLNRVPLDISNLSLTTSNFRDNRTDLIKGNFRSTETSSPPKNKLKRLSYF